MLPYTLILWSLVQNSVVFLVLTKHSLLLSHSCLSPYYYLYMPDSLLPKTMHRHKQHKQINNCCKKIRRSNSPLPRRTKRHVKEEVAKRNNMKKLSIILLSWVIAILLVVHTGNNTSYAQLPPIGPNADEGRIINAYVSEVFIMLNNNQICKPTLQSGTCFAQNEWVFNICSFIPNDGKFFPRYICDLAEAPRYFETPQHVCYKTNQTYPISSLKQITDPYNCLPFPARVPSPTAPAVGISFALIPSPTNVPTPTPIVLPRGTDKPFEIGIAANAPDPSVVADLNARWVRINFINFHTRRHGMYGYDWLINEYTRRNIKVIGLINHEVDPSFRSDNPEAFLNTYVESAAEIINTYKDKVKVYELFNEPNNHIPGTERPTLDATMFAKYMAAVYKKVKIDMGIKNVTIVSGPLFAHPGGDSMDYLMATYNNGKRNLKGDLNWETIKQKTGSYPLDAIGYHLYVAEWTTNANEIKEWYYRYLDNVNKTLIELKDYPKPIYITEFSFQVGRDITPEGQAKNMETAFGLLKDYRFNGDQPVKLALWYTLEIGGNAPFGIWDRDTRRPGFYSFQAIGKQNL